MSEERTVSEQQALQRAIYDDFLRGKTIQEISAERSIDFNNVYCWVFEEELRARACRELGR